VIFNGPQVHYLANKPLVGQSFPAVSIVLICTNDLNEKSAILWRIIPHLFDDMNSEIGYAQFSHGEM
jgi:hypothetical protein